MHDEVFNKKLIDYFLYKREEIKKKFNRVLPAGEYIFDRYEKARYLGAGEGTSIYDTSIIMGDIDIGKNVWIGPYTLLEGINDKITIGNNVSVDSGVKIYTHDTTKFMVSGGVNDVERGPVSIGDNTVIVTMTTVKHNVKIGKCCVIGAHSFVNKDIPDYSVAFGVPVSIVGRVVIDDSGKCSFVYGQDYD